MDAVVSALSDYPEFVPVVARWHWREWGHSDPAGSFAHGQRAWPGRLARARYWARYGHPPLRETLLLPPGAHAPARKYLDWHRHKIFVA